MSLHDVEIAYFSFVYGLIDDRISFKIKRNLNSKLKQFLKFQIKISH